MPIKIVVDSCCEIPVVWKNRVVKAPLTIDLDDKTFVDDDKLDMAEYLRKMKNMKSFKTSCPSTQTYMDLFEGDEDVIVITLSNNLSGSYQSAYIAKDMYFEIYGNKKIIHIVDSMSASASETAILVKLIELCDKNLDTEQVIEQIEKFRDEHKILFMLQSLANLGKAGRVSPFVATAASVLGIRCIMSRTDDGHIELRKKVVGEKRCIKDIAKQISKMVSDVADRTLCISHCESKERVELFLKDLSDHMDINRFKDIIITHTSGLSSLYADFGGIIIAF